MAHIFKHPEGTNKGIIVFTHKEIHFFKLAFHSWRFAIINRLQSKIGLDKYLKFYVKKQIDNIKKNYYIGIHFGSYHETFPSYDFVDFYMSGEGTLKYPDPKVFFIPLNSRSFSSVQFSPISGQKKRFDILCIARNAKFKNLDKFLMSVRKLYDLGYAYKIMLFVATPPLENSVSHYINIENDYYRLFSEKERESFIMIKLSRKYSFLGVGSSYIKQLYQDSKIFTLFSDIEGESRVISEALLCGLPVVVWDQLRGGGRDLLNNSNSRQFDSYDDAYQALIDSVENLESFNLDVDGIAQKTREDYSLIKLKQFFEDFYNSKESNFDGSLINTDKLWNRLPGHEGSVPWATSRNRTADIISKKQFFQFIGELRLQ